MAHAAASNSCDSSGHSTGTAPALHRRGRRCGALGRWPPGDRVV